MYNAGGGILIYIKKGIPCKRMKKLENDCIETVVVEISIGKQKWGIITINRNEDVTVDTFLTNISKTVDSLLNSYEDIIIIGDININSLQKDSRGFKKLKEFLTHTTSKILLRLLHAFKLKVRPH